MNDKEYIKALNAMIYLDCCAVNRKIPSAEKIAQMNIDNVFEAAQKHMLTALTAFALESAGVFDGKFTEEKYKAVCKVATLDSERKSIIDKLEKQGIWYMPLKGVILKDLYPEFGMRQMSDNDILFDPAYREDVKQIMIDNGFTVGHFGKGKDDAYFKQPVSNFEMHILLAADTDGNKAMHPYYEHIKNKLLKDPDNRCGYHFSNDDMYIYLCAHESKHYNHGGTGIRSLIDTYVFLKKYGDTLNMKYIVRECEKLGIAEFEKDNRELSLDLFGCKKLSDKDKKMLRYIAFSGTYGTFDNTVKNKLKKANGSMMRYAVDRLFMPMNTIRDVFPFFYKHKWLIPILPFYRVIKGLATNRKLLKKEFNLLNKQ